MGFSRETVVCILIFCTASNFFSITTYVIGNYRQLGSDGLIYDILLGMETGVNVVSDLALLNVLHVSGNPLTAYPHAKVVEVFRQFLTVNSGTIVFCGIVHIGASHYLSRKVRVENARDAAEVEAVRNIIFQQLSIFYVLLAAVKGLILYNMYGFYMEFKDNPPTQGILLVLNPLAALKQPIVFVGLRSPTTQTR
ncbi:uncharacterized protein LOC144119661 [Amblyomma americanum]